METPMDIFHRMTWSESVDIWVRERISLNVNTQTINNIDKVTRYGKLKEILPRRSHAWDWSHGKLKGNYMCVVAGRRNK